MERARGGKAVMNDERIKPIVWICIIALIAITIIASVSVITMCVQSNRAMAEGREAFRIYMETDYEYPAVSQSTDVKVGE